MPQHISTRYAKENSHFAQLHFNEGEIESCADWDHLYYNEPIPHHVTPCGLLLLDDQSINKFPNFVFCKDLKCKIPLGYTAMYIVIKHEYDGMNLIPLNKNSYCLDSKDKIPLNSKDSYEDQYGNITVTFCEISNENYWKIAFETMKKHSKLKDFSIRKKDCFLEQQGPMPNLVIKNIEDRNWYLLKNVDQRQLIEGDSRMITAPCEFTERKVLVCAYSRNSFPATFQNLMLNEMKWHLYDLKDHSRKLIYPVVYSLSNDDDMEMDLTFKIQRNWKKFNNSISNIESCKSGDLNGGYSDKLLYMLTKNGKKLSENDIINYTPSAIAISEQTDINYPEIISFRPFHSNPDLFQVQLIFSNLVDQDELKNTKMGYMFSFQFKIIEEFTKTNESLFEKLKTQTLTDCTFEFVQY